MPTNRIYDAACCFFEGLMLPNTNDRPPSSLEGGVIAQVAVYVARDLRVPVVAVRDRLSAVLRARVPETPVDEDSDSSSRENDVCTTGTARLGSDIDVEPQPTAMKSGTERALGSRVDTSIPLHHRTDCSG